MTKTIRVQKIKSIIGRPDKHRRVLFSLGLRKINQIRELQDNDSVRGMIFKVSHLVRVLD